MPDLNQIEPLHLTGLADYHCHCDYSVDATGTVDEYCRVALHRGLAEICFTTHYDNVPGMQSDDAAIRIDGELKPISPENLAPYVNDVRQAAEKYLPLGLSVKLGLEFGWYEGCEDEVRRVRELYPFEYMLCGIHELDGICFCCPGRYQQCFERFTAEEAAERYSRQVVTAARSGMFDTIAHLDYPRKYGLKVYGESLDRAIMERAKAEMFPTLKASDTCLEINTSAMRRGLNDYFPRIGLINEARRAGVNVYYLGSDAHAPEHVGADFDVAASLAGMTGVGCEETD